MQKIIIGNLKMNLLSFSDREQYVNLFKRENKSKRNENVEIVLCPPFIHLEGMNKSKIKNVSLGAQNVFWEEKGSFTGEISPKMLKNFGCEYVILGHSERRRFFCERDEEVNLKIISALKNGIRPILCVGENRGEKVMVVEKQLENCLKDVNRGKMENMVICYEPVWAISSNKPDHLPTTNDVMSARLLIKRFLVKKYGIKISEKVKIIYGGSVSTRNVEEVCIKSEMDGVLVGKESLAPYEFLKIASILNNNF